MKRRTFLKNLGLAASLPAVINLGGLPVRAAGLPGPRKLKVLTCNIRADVAADASTGDSWTQRKDLCGDVIAAQHPDIFGLQETHLPHFTYLKSRFPGFETFALYTPGSKPAPLNAVFYSGARFEAVSSGGFWLSDTPHIPGSSSWDSANPRLVNWVDLKERETGRPFRFWNTHFDHISQKAREHSATMVLEAGKPLPAELPQLLTGDLNAGGTNRAIRILKEGGWIDTYGAVNQPAEPGLTGHAFKGEKAVATRSNGVPKEKIDWVFCRDGFKPVSAAVIRDSRNGHYPSDHYFVSAEVLF